MKSVTAKAPGKLILSGEHAVVHGCPALATAIDLYTTTTVSLRPSPGVLFDLVNLLHKRERPYDALKTFTGKLQKKYQRFRQGELGIRDVLKKPFELVEYTASHALQKFQHQHDQGFHVRTVSDIPTGCGLGSSAASIVSTNFALNQLSQEPLDDEALQQLNLHAENLQHGQSSGVDVYLSMHGGCHLFQNNASKLRPAWHQELLLVNTGTPTSGTGECVKHTSEIFNKQPDLLKQFTAVTQQMDTAWCEQSSEKLQHAIRQNHRLLVEMGVVPRNVADFIDQVEQHGGAAKICGAGAIRGDNAGIVWCYGIAKTQLQRLCQSDWKILSIHSVAHGVAV